MPVTELDDRTALVTIDLQNGILELPTAPYPAVDVVAAAARLSEAFRSTGRPVVHVRVSYAPDFGDAVAPRCDRQLQHPEPRPGWNELSDALHAQPTDICVIKHNVGAFVGTDLDTQLRRRRVTGIVLSGIATTVGVESTARSAVDHGYNVTIASDAVTDLDVTAHENSLKNVLPLFAEVDTADEIIAVLTA